MRSIGIGLMILAVAAGVGAQQIDYGAVWETATPFDRFLSSGTVAGGTVEVAICERRDRRRRIDANARAEGRRRILVIAEDPCADRPGRSRISRSWRPRCPSDSRSESSPVTPGASAQEHRTPSGGR